MIKINANHIPIFFIISLLFLSGCIQTTQKTTVTGKGIVITDFSSSRDAVEGKDKTVRIYMEVENQGSYATDSVLMCLLGSFGKTSESMWKRSEDTPQCQKSGRKLEAYDPVNNLPGGTARSAWTLYSPWLPYPQQTTEEFTGRVYYQYKTRTTVKVTVFTEGEIEAAKQRGEPLSSISEQVKSISPVDISLSTQSLIRAEDGYFTLKITVSNTGGGIVFDNSKVDFASDTPPSLDTDSLNIAKLNINYPTSALKIEACESEIELKKGETRTVSCDFTILEDIKTKKTYPITVEAEYGYYVESTLTITARGKREETP